MVQSGWSLRCRCLGWLLALCCGTVCAQEPCLGIFPATRHVEIRDPACLPRANLPQDGPPPTVDSTTPRDPRKISLDEAIRAALGQSEIVRVLAGSVPVNSGRSLYDPAIASMRIDQAQSAFDPTFDTRQDFLRNETPFARLDPLDPRRALIDGTRSDLYDTTVGVTKKSLHGGTATLRVDSDLLRQQPGPVLLNPQSRPSLVMGLNQPLLEGAGRAVNQVPIVLARINTEQSFFQLKGSLQRMVQQVIQAYWELIAARTSLWATEQQEKQAEFAVRLETARQRIGISDQAQLAQARTALANFQANLIAAQGLVLTREAALRAILAIPPSGPEELVPTTPPVSDGIKFDWAGLLDLADVSRPDLIELKLVLEADQQQLLLARNQTLPRLDANMLYRWNGLEGEIPSGADLRSDPGAFTDWQLGVNFSVPIGLRGPRAALRQQELILARDRADLDLAMLQVVHEIAAVLRQLDQDYRQYKAFGDARRAADDNLRQQFTGFRTGRLEFINVLEAITNWGNAVRSEAQALTQYNTDLATLEELTGTILEAHGVRLFEERYRSLGPLGLPGHEALYPRLLRPQPNLDRYGQQEKPAEEAFDLTTPDFLLRERRPRDDPDDAPSPSDRDPLRRLPGDPDQSPDGDDDEVRSLPLGP